MRRVYCHRRVCAVSLYPVCCCLFVTFRGNMELYSHYGYNNAPTQNTGKRVQVHIICIYMNVIAISEIDCMCVNVRTQKRPPQYC